MLTNASAFDGFFAGGTERNVALSWLKFQRREV